MQSLAGAGRGRGGKQAGMEKRGSREGAALGIVSKKSAAKVG